MIQPVCGYIYIYIDRLFRCITSLQYAYTRETLKAGIEPSLTLHQTYNITLSLQATKQQVVSQHVVEANEVTCNLILNTSRVKNFPLNTIILQYWHKH